MTDPIVEEIRRVRDAHPATFDYDLDAIFQDIKELEKHSGLTFVSYPPRRVVPNPTPQAAGTATPVSDTPKVSESAPAVSP